MNELLNKWRHVLDQFYAKRIFTWTEPLSLAYCAEVASKSTMGVEVGVYMGASAWVMLQANPRLHLWAADLFMVAGTQMVASNNLATFIDQGRCELIVGDSAKAASMLQHEKGNLDYVFSDNGHAKEDLVRDITSFLPLIKSGGQLFGHDFEVPHNDVAQGVLSVLPSDKVEIVVPRVWKYQKP